MDLIKQHPPCLHYPPALAMYPHLRKRQVSNCDKAAADRRDLLKSYDSVQNWLLVIQAPKRLILMVRAEHRVPFWEYLSREEVELGNHLHLAIKAEEADWTVGSCSLAQEMLFLAGSD